MTTLVLAALVLSATPEVVSAKDDPRECKLLLDAKGQPVLAWTHGPEVITKELTVATRGKGGKGWDERVVGTCGVRCSTSLTLDAKGVLRASFSSTCDGTAPTNKCMRVAELLPKKLGMLTTPVTLNGGTSSALLVGKDGTVHLGYAAHDDKAFLYGTFVKGVWTPGPTPPAQGFEFDSRFNMAFDKKGTPTALFDDKSRHLSWVHWQGGKVESEPVTFEGAGRDSSYVLGADDVPHAVFTLNEKEVAHATRGASGWSVETVAKVASGVAVDATLAIAKDGSLHVAWYEPASGALRYATRAAAETEWKVKTLDGKNTQQAGLQPSIAVDAKGATHFCYQALAEKAVKYLVIEK